MVQRVLLAIMIGALFFACHPIEAFNLSEEVVFDYRQTKINSDEHLRIQFDGVVADDRCPVEYNCLTPGNAQVKFTLKKGLRKESIVLNIYDSPQRQIALGYQLDAFELSPPNSVDNPPSQHDYEVSLFVDPPHPNGLCDSNSDCDSGEFCDWCGTSSCPMCDDCVPRCRPLPNQ